MRSTTAMVNLAFLILLVGPATVFGQTGNFLGRTGTDWARQLTADNSDVGQRRGAAFALGRLGADAEFYLPKLLHRAQNDANPGVRETAAMALGDVILAVEQRFRLQKEREQLPATPEHWDKLGPALVERIGQEKNAGARRGLVYALGAMGPAAVKALPTLQAALKDASPAVRQNAAWALGRLGPAGGPAVVNDLCTLLGDAEPLVRRDAATALGDIGLPTASPAVKPLLDLIDRESKKDTGDPVVFKTALEKIVKLVSSKDQKLADRLYPYLAWEDAEIAQPAAFALSNIGGLKSRLALPILQEALRDEDPHVQENAASALGQMKEVAAPAVLDLTNALEASTVGVRKKAAVALAHIGPLAEPAVPKLAQVLKGEKEPDLDVRLFAGLALFEIGEEANQKAIPTVVEVIRHDPNRQIRHRCIDVLFKVKDVHQNRVRDTLYEVVDNAQEPAFLRQEAARVLALHLHEQATDRVADTLLEMLKSPDIRLYKGAELRVNETGENRGNSGVKDIEGGDGRFLAAEALGWLRGKANQKEIIKELEKTAMSEDANLRKYSNEALRLIKGGK